MAKGGTVIFDFKGDASDLNNSIANISNDIGKMTTKAGKALSIGLTTPLTILSKKAVSTSIEFVKLKESSMGVFEKMLGGSEAAEQMYQSLLNVAKASTYSQEAFLTAGKTLVGMGTNAQDTTRYLQAITDAVAGFGGSSSDIESLASVFGKVSAKGKVLTDDLNMLSERGVNGLQILAAHYGKTTDEMQKMVSSGMVPAKEGLDILCKGMEDGYTYAGEFHQGLAGMAQQLKGGTLTGALDGLNSSFRNFSLGLTNAFDNKQYMIDLINSFGTALSNLPIIFSSVTDSIAPFLQGLTSFINKFNELAQTESGQEQLKKIGNVVVGLASAGPVLLGIGKAFNVFGDINSKISTVSSNLGLFSNKLGGLLPISSSASSKLGILTKLFSSGLGMAALGGIALVALGGLDSAFGDTINSMLDKAITEGPTIITNLVNGIVSKIPELTQKGGELLQKFLQAIITNAPVLLQGGIQLIVALAQGLAEQMPTLIPLIVQGILSLIPVIIENAPLFIKAGAQLIIGIVQGLIQSIPVLLSQAKNIGLSLINCFKQLPSMMLDIGKNLLMGLWNGISNVTGWIIGKIKGFGSSVLKAIKGIFGIHSPSKEFAWIGKMNILGLEQGMEDMKGDVQATFDDLVNLSPTMLASASNSYNPNVNVVVNNSFEQDPLGDMVQKQKTFSGGSKNDFNFGMGVSS